LIALKELPSMKRTIVFLLAATLMVAACSEKEKEGGGKEGPCSPAPAALATTPTLPAGFPSPAELKYTDSQVAGPSTIVQGYWDGDLEAAFEGLKDAFTGDGYTVTHDEKEADDAEVNFSGGNSTGQVKLVTECERRTSVTITVRPG
jgi:hypothetical protein